MVRRSAAGRRGRQQSGSSITQLEWRTIENPYQPIEILSDDQVEAICETAFRILEEVGMDILHEEARILLARGLALTLKAAMTGCVSTAG